MQQGCDIFGFSYDKNWPVWYFFQAKFRRAQYILSRDILRRRVPSLSHIGNTFTVFLRASSLWCSCYSIFSSSHCPYHSIFHFIILFISSHLILSSISLHLHLHCIVLELMVYIDLPIRCFWAFMLIHSFGVTRDWLLTTLLHIME